MLRNTMTVQVFWENSSLVLPHAVPENSVRRESVTTWLQVKGEGKTDGTEDETGARAKSVSVACHLLGIWTPPTTDTHIPELHCDDVGHNTLKLEGGDSYRYFVWPCTRSAVVKTEVELEAVTLRYRKGRPTCYATGQEEILERGGVKRADEYLAELCMRKNCEDKRRVGRLVIQKDYQNQGTHSSFFFPADFIHGLSGILLEIGTEEFRVYIVRDLTMYTRT
ncbi:hypothetical protein BaRGS_00023775 [Batillaria attramentaria]|uniref:Uncharacterized protein n=1 Tax=Batillaria attramentaria TaxID=370345 RepID=A0ABD0KDA3_9CAEN